MMYTDGQPTKGGAWLAVEDDSKIVYQIDPSGETVEFVFHGPMELGVGMSAQLVRRCQDLFGEASAEMHRVQQTES
jgi:hypothetical protein